jgi:S1-C subfamily serine protease
MNGSGLIDVILIVLLVWQFVSGWQRGFLGTLLSLLGLVGGAAVAIGILPALPTDRGPLADPAVRALFTLALLITLTSIGYRLGVLLARRLRPAEPLSGATSALGGLLGGLLAVAVTAVLVWSLGVSARGTDSPIASAVGRSTVLRSIDQVVPDRTTRLFAPLERALDQQGFPRVFEGLGVERIRGIEAPDQGVAADPRVRAASESVLKITATSRRCGSADEGSGWVAADGLVVTNAHVVAGAEALRVEDRSGRAWEGSVVRFDPRRDVAVVRVDGLPLAPIPQGGQLDRGDSSVVAGYPWDGPLTLGAARVREVLTARGADIYGSPGVAREMYAVRGTVVPGNSGGPLLTPSGAVVGVVFAKSTDHPDTGYVLTNDEIAPVLAGAGAAEPVATGACVG